MIVKSKEMEENKFINMETLDCYVSRKTYVWLYEQSDKSQHLLQWF